MWEIEVERESVRAAALELHTADVHFTGVCNIFRNLDCKSPLSVEKIGKRKKNFQLISTAFSPFFFACNRILQESRVQTPIPDITAIICRVTTAQEIGQNALSLNIHPTVLQRQSASIVTL